MRLVFSSSTCFFRIEPRSQCLSSSTRYFHSQALHSQLSTLAENLAVYSSLALVPQPTSPILVSTLLSPERVLPSASPVTAWSVTELIFWWCCWCWCKYSCLGCPVRKEQAQEQPDGVQAQHNRKAHSTALTWPLRKYFISHNLHSLNWKEQS